MIYLGNKHDNVTICMQYMWPIRLHSQNLAAWPNSCSFWDSIFCSL